MGAPRTLGARLALASLTLLAMAALPGVASARPDTKGSNDMYRYQPGDVVKSYPSPGGAFRVHYTETEAGGNAVPAGDKNGNGTPDYVEEVAVLYDEVLAFYEKLGFRAPPMDGATKPDNGGDERFDVYLLDFNLKADGHFTREGCQGEVCSGYMVQENDFAGYAYPSATVGNRILSSHEFFHAVQAGYDVGQSSIISEGTAVWATEKFDSSLNDFEGFLPEFYKRPERSIDKPLPGAVDPFSYATAIWFQFLDEHLGSDVVRKLWEDCKDGARGVDNPDWFSVLPALLERDFATSFDKELVEFAKWNLLTGRFADPKRGWARGSGYPIVATTSGTLPYQDSALRLFYASSQYVRVMPAGRAAMTAVVKLNPGQDASALRLFVATRGQKVGDLLDLPALPAANPATVDTSAADELLVVAVNTARSGDSLKGTLCIGTPDEVAPCLPAPTDAGPSPFDDGSSPPYEASSCRVGPRASGTDHAPVVLLSFALCALVLRRRAREPRA